MITRSMLGPAISLYPAASPSPTELAVVGSRGLGVARRREVLKTRPGFPADSTSHVRAPASADSAMSSPPLLPQRPEVVRSTRRGPRVCIREIAEMRPLLQAPRAKLERSGTRCLGLASSASLRDSRRAPPNGTPSSGLSTQVGRWLGTPLPNRRTRLVTRSKTWPA